MKIHEDTLGVADESIFTHDSLVRKKMWTHRVLRGDDRSHVYLIKIRP
jgi:hypothetical protein